MADYLFLFTIGPVQEFIAAARRTRDLWAGSQLLSELSRTAAIALRDDHNGILIFPAPDDQDTKLEKHDVVNRILVSVQTDDPKNICEDIEGKIKQRLDAHRIEQLLDKKDSIVAETFNGIPGLTASVLRQQAETQVADLIEIYWAAVKRTDNYEQDRENVEAALAARKNTRDFVQPVWASNAPKSSIDGLRESVIDEDVYPERNESAERQQQKIQELFDHYGAKGAERLSGVDLLKRHYRPRHIHADFPSTSHFAALPILNRFKKSFQAEATKRWKEYLEALKRQGVNLDKLDRQRTYHLIIEDFDASLLFGERLSDVIEDPKKREYAKRALRTFLSAFTNGKEPEPYYALLHGDGDFMGKTIDSLAKDDIEKHREFSRALDAFASGVRTIVEEEPHLGALVYSGGDDVLALLPLHTVVQCAKELAMKFDEQMGTFEYIDKDTKRHPTLSIGIAICHHLEPLSDALNLARGAEKLAKKVPGKNALAITLSKRGTGDRTINGSWNKLFAEDDKRHTDNDGFYERLQKLTEWHRSGAIPDSAAYDLHNLIEQMGDTLPLSALRAEAVRIVKRKRGQQGAAAEANKELVALAETLPKDEDKELAKYWNVLQFANELIVTREFAKV